MRNRRTILLTYASLSVALFKLKEDTDPERVKEWQRLAQGMVGKVPGALPCAICGCSIPTHVSCVTGRLTILSEIRPYRPSCRLTHRTHGTHG